MRDCVDEYEGTPPAEFEFNEPCEVEDDGLPPSENLADAIRRNPPLKSELIDGVLRHGHKMMIAGPSKAGKSFALIELCVCIAAGKPWLGRFHCKQGKVLYINLELDKASCLHRFKDVCDALEFSSDDLQSLHNIRVWHLRGYPVSWEHFLDLVCRRVKKRGFDAVIIDPFYKLNAGCENNAQSMAQFCNGIDRIAVAADSAVIYCHHHSKGDQSWKSSMDRASGSGVFARDVDALLDITELELPPDRRRDGVTAWRIEGTLREFASFDPVDVWFNYPIHVLEHFDPAENVAPHAQLPAHQRAMNARKSKEQKLRERHHRLEAAFDILESSGEPVTVRTLAEYLGVNNQTVRNMIDEHAGFDREKQGRSGKIWRTSQKSKKQE